jgi:hypothetical protein
MLPVLPLRVGQVLVSAKQFCSEALLGDVVLYSNLSLDSLTGKTVNNTNLNLRIIAT